MYKVLIEPYKQITLRHLDMADTLLDSRLHDGAAFHVYHAYESIVCAAILKRQSSEMPPLTHTGKLDRFRQVFARERAIAAESTKLSGKLHPMRNRVLYPELRELFVIMPAESVSERQVRKYLSQVKEFVNRLIGQLGL